MQIRTVHGQWSKESQAVKKHDLMSFWFISRFFLFFFLLSSFVFSSFLFSLLQLIEPFLYCNLNSTSFSLGTIQFVLITYHNLLQWLLVMTTIRTMVNWIIYSFLPSLYTIKTWPERSNHLHGWSFIKMAYQQLLLVSYLTLLSHEWSPSR